MRLGKFSLRIPLGRNAQCETARDSGRGANHSRCEWLAVREMVGNAEGPSKKRGRAT
jgi:hypothetical protein